MKPVQIQLKNSVLRKVLKRLYYPLEVMLCLQKKKGQKMKDEFPKLAELKQLLSPEKVNDSIFNNFENSIYEKLGKHEAFVALENELRKISGEAWTYFKSEINSRLLDLKNGRGFEPFLDMLNEVRAFNYLNKDLGCSNVVFIKTNKKETPDLKAELDGKILLCEVKTINPSDDETEKRNIVKNGGMVTGCTQNKLSDQFFDKLKSTLSKAKSQLLKYPESGSARNLIFLVINFDDLFSEYKEEYYSQIDEYLQGYPVGEFEIVIFNQNTAFHKNIVMKSAMVVDES